MAKTPNPSKGFVPCPVCQTPSTVHMVGEGRLIETGEPPKNGRNLGLHYYRCPKCGNSSMSKSVSQYCIDHLVSTESAVQPLPAKPEPTIPDLVEAVEPVLESTVEPLVETPQPGENIEPSLLNELPTEPNDVKSEPRNYKPMILKVTGCLALLLVVVLIAKHMLRPAPELEVAANGHD